MIVYRRLIFSLMTITAIAMVIMGIYAYIDPKHNSDIPVVVGVIGLSALLGAIALWAIALCRFNVINNSVTPNQRKCISDSED